MLRNGSRLAATMLLGLTLAACGKDSTAPKNSDIPEDPGTPAPAVAPTTGDFVPSAMSVAEPSSSNPDRIRLTLGGTASELTYSTSNVTVVEDGVVKGIKLSRGSAAKLKTDIVFVIDNTGSMSSGIESVKNSVISLVSALRASGQDVQVGVVAYNDNGDNDGHATYNVPTSDVMGYAAVYGYRPLTSNLTATGPIVTFMEDLTATGGGDWPELAFSGVDYARRTFAWRDGSQRVYILITDATSWGQGATGDATRGIGASYPWTDVTLGEQLRSEGSVVHCICPENELATSLSTGEYNVKPLATITGGTFTEWAYAEFDLTDLPLLGVTTSTALIEFLKTDRGAAPTEHTLRVVIEKSGTERGERTLTVEY